MSATSSAFTMRFAANMADLERELKRLQQINNRAAQRMQDAHKRAAQQSQDAWKNTNLGRILEGQISSVGPMLKGLAATIAATFAGREALAAAERWTTFGNSLRVAGLAGENLKGVQDKLYQAAIKNGVELEPLGQLYGRLSQSQKELGASQGQMIKFTEGITAALRVQGGPAEAASGALMQLSQALAGGVVRAEEFNSINEGARPILEAVAAGWKKQGMTVSGLRKVMLDGKLTSQEFFNAFLNGSQMLEEKAARAPLTVGQAMTNLHTALTRYVGETNEAYGVTDRITTAIKWLSENLGTVAKSIMVVGGLYAATFLPALGMAGKSMVAFTAATVTNTIAGAANTVQLIQRTAAIYGVSTASATATVAARGLSTALSWFGGPVGIAFMAISAAVGYLGYSAAEAALETENLKRRIEANTAALDTAAGAASRKRIESGNLTEAERASAIHTASLTGEVHKLKDAYWLAAAAAKALAVEQARTAFLKNVDTMREARTGYESRLEEEMGRERRAGGFAERGLSSQSVLSPEQYRRARLAALNSEEGKLFRQSVSNTQRYADAYQAEKGTPLAAYRSTPAPAPAATGPKKKTGAKPRDNSSASERVEEQAEKAYHQALHARAKTAE